MPSFYSSKIWAYWSHLVYGRGKLHTLVFWHSQLGDDNDAAGGGAAQPSPGDQGVGSSYKPAKSEKSGAGSYCLGCTDDKGSSVRVSMCRCRSHSIGVHTVSVQVETQDVGRVVTGFPFRGCNNWADNFLFPADSISLSHLHGFSFSNKHEIIVRPRFLTVCYKLRLIMIFQHFLFNFVLTFFRHIWCSKIIITKIIFPWIFYHPIFNILNVIISANISRSI